jgi:hypothetical protein
VWPTPGVTRGGPAERTTTRRCRRARSLRLRWQVKRNPPFVPHGGDIS